MILKGMKDEMPIATRGFTACLSVEHGYTCLVNPVLQAVLHRNRISAGAGRKVSLLNITG